MRIAGAARLLAATAGAVLLLGSTVACGSDADPGTARSVTVVGTGKATGTPDLLTADVSIASSAADVSAALNTAGALVRKVTDAVVAAGVETKDVATQNVTLTPSHTNPAPGTAAQITGYTATNSLRLTIRNLPKASAVLAAAATAGGDDTRISNVSFSIDDDSALTAKARDAAFNDARARADQYASLAGDKLGKVLTITENSTADQPNSAAPTFARDVAPIPLEPGQQSLTFTVTVKYQLD